jgi:hypothetical protein
MLEARTFLQFQEVIEDSAPVNQYDNTLVRYLAPPTLQPQLIIRPGESRTEYRLADICTSEKLRKILSDRLIQMTRTLTSKIFVQNLSSKLRK